MYYLHHYYCLEIRWFGRRQTDLVCVPANGYLFTSLILIAPNKVCQILKGIVSSYTTNKKQFFLFYTFCEKIYNLILCYMIKAKEVHFFCFIFSIVLTMIFCHSFKYYIINSFFYENMNNILSDLVLYFLGCQKFIR